MFDVYGFQATGLERQFDRVADVLGAIRFPIRRCAGSCIENIITPAPRNLPGAGRCMPKYVLTEDSQAASRQSESNP